MSDRSIGWVMDKDTSKRRLHLSLSDAGVELRVSVPGQPPATVTLDAQGIEALYTYVVQAYTRVLTGEGHWAPQRGQSVPGTLEQRSEARVHRWEAEAHLANALVELVQAAPDCTLSALLQTWTRLARAVVGAFICQGDAEATGPVDVPALLAALDGQLRQTLEGEGEGA